MGQHVLIVEDNILNIEVAQIILEKNGYEVSVATSGHAAYRKALAIKPDVVLMDYHLTGMNGLDTVKLFKEHSELCDIPIIAVTADIYSEKDFLEAGCSKYIAKPIRKTMLLRAVGDVLPTSEAAN